MTRRHHAAGLLALGAALALLPASAPAAPTGSGPATRATAASAGPARSVSARSAPVRRRSASVPPVHHVFVINIENKGYDQTWGPGSKAPYLARTLRHRGVLLDHYYGTAHHSQPNYVAQVSGQGPNPQMQADCQRYSRFRRTGTQPPGQAQGTGCVFGRHVRSLPVQLSRHGLRWRGYMDDMDRRCQHPRLGRQDQTQQATPRHNYAARHNPFVYFRQITARAHYCARHVVRLGALRDDLQHRRTTPNLSYLTPDLCDDGHDAPCANGRTGGLVAVNRWMKRWVPRILRSPAFRRDGMLVITADESDGPQQDATACCDEKSANTPRAGILGPGGGRIGALVISQWTKPRSRSTTPYNHYSLLASLEAIFGLPRLGYAGQHGLDRFGLDVYNSGWNR